MIAHCWLAASPFAVRLTVLYASRFGPTDMSYHDIYQSPGTSIRMLSWYRPPLYPAGSFGVRCSIRPPPATAAESRNSPFGPSDSLNMSWIGSVQYTFDQSGIRLALGGCVARSPHLD